MGDSADDALKDAVRCRPVRFDGGEAGSEAERWRRSGKYCWERAEVRSQRIDHTSSLPSDVTFSVISV